MALAVLIFSLEILFGAAWSCCNNRKSSKDNPSYVDRLFSGSRARKFFDRQQQLDGSGHQPDWTRGREVLDRVLAAMARHPDPDGDPAGGEALAFELEMILKRLRESLAARRGQGHQQRQFGMEGSAPRRFGFNGGTLGRGMSDDSVHQWETKEL